MTKKIRLLILIIIAVNLCFITIPLSVKNIRLEKANQQYHTQIKEDQHSAKVSEEEHYQVINNIRAAMKNSGIRAISENISMKGHLRYGLSISANREKLENFCNLLNEMNEKIYLTEANIDFDGPGNATLLLEYYGDSND